MQELRHQDAVDVQAKEGTVPFILFDVLRHTSEFLLPNFKKPLFPHRNCLPRAQGLFYSRVGFNARRFME